MNLRKPHYVKLKGVVKGHVITVADSWLQQYDQQVVEVLIRAYRRKHTDEQRGYYWAVVVPHVQHLLVTESGYTPAEVPLPAVHLLLKTLHLQQRFPEWTDYKADPVSLSIMTAEELSVYIESIAVWCLDEFQSVLPPAEKTA